MSSEEVIPGLITIIRTAQNVLWQETIYHETTQLIKTGHACGDHAIEAAAVNSWAGTMSSCGWANAPRSRLAALVGILISCCHTDPVWLPHSRAGLAGKGDFVILGIFCGHPSITFWEGKKLFQLLSHFFPLLFLILMVVLRCDSSKGNLKRSTSFLCISTNPGTLYSYYNDITHSF